MVCLIPLWQKDLSESACFMLWNTKSWWVQRLEKWCHLSCQPRVGPKPWCLYCCGLAWWEEWIWRPSQRLRKLVRCLWLLLACGEQCDSGWQAAVLSSVLASFYFLWLEMLLKVRKTLGFLVTVCWIFMLFYSMRKEDKTKVFCVCSIDFMCMGSAYPL